MNTILFLAIIITGILISTISLLMIAMSLSTISNFIKNIDIKMMKKGE
jgi:hypothetical protein